jgi:hypothetical protein
VVDLDDAAPGREGQAIQAQGQLVLCHGRAAHAHSYKLASLRVIEKGIHLVRAERLAHHLCCQPERIDKVGGRDL